MQILHVALPLHFFDVDAQSQHTSWSTCICTKLHVQYAPLDCFCQCTIKLQAGASNSICRASPDQFFIRVYPDAMLLASMRGVGLQVTSEPTLAPLLSELIHSRRGQEVRLREPADYHIHDLNKTSFAEVAEYARSKNETAIGYVAHQTYVAHSASMYS